MKQIVVLFYCCLALPVVRGYAQSDDVGVWISTEVKKKIFPGFDAYAEGEFRTRDGLGSVERLAATAGVSYRLMPWLKADGGYTFIYSNRLGELTKKANWISSYWSPRHRLSVSLTGRYIWKRVEFSLRERYQFTYRTPLSVPKYDGDNGMRKADEEISGKSKNVLRSRLQAEWNIRKSPFSPYVSCELYHSMTDGWILDKTRWTLGTGYKVSKKHAFDFFYRYQNHSDEDEANGHVWGAGYKLKF